MRRLPVILLCALVVVPTAVAASRATGDGVLELKSVYGTVQFGKEGQAARGVLWGQMDKGRLTVIDPVGSDAQTIFVSGYEHKSVPKVDDLTGAIITVYSGVNLHFRVTGGKYRLLFNGLGIDLTAIGVGVAYLNGDDTAIDPGYFAIDSGKWLPVPLAAPTAVRGVPEPFGTQPVTPPATP
jgi:hypothetical protein